MQSEIIDQIRAWHRKRCFVMETRKRADLALGSTLRTWLGWRRDLEKEQSDRIKDLATKLMDCGEKLAKGKPHALSDTEEWKEYGDIIMASIGSRAPTDALEKLSTKEMERLAAMLPAWTEFGEGIRGFGARSLAVIIGEAGDLSNYANHSKLWKRMGLAVMDGVRQGGLRGSASKDDWIAHGYSPVRRSRMFVIGDALIKSNGEGTYRSAYLARKRYERDRAVAEGLTVAPAAKIPAKRKGEFISDGHIHLRAQRYMEKRLLRDLWKAWRRAEEAVAVKPAGVLPDDEIRDAPSGAAEVMVEVRASADDGLPPLLFTDAAQAAGQAVHVAPYGAARDLPDPHSPDAPLGAGEAEHSVPLMAVDALPLHQFRDAEQSAGQAVPAVPSLAFCQLPDHPHTGPKPAIVISDEYHESTPESQSRAEAMIRSIKDAA